MKNPQWLFSQRIRNDKIFFINKMLGLPLHDGQVRWLSESICKINMLRPGNRWGKTLITACKHIHQLICKPGIQEQMLSPEEWLDQPYETLNFGPGYEQAREVPRLMKDIIEGRVLLPKQFHKEWGRTNKSMLKGWAIMDDRIEAQMLPSLTLMTGGKLLIRSYSEMGAAFKAKSLAYISGDECADIAELWTFTNNTLLPRLISLGGDLDFVGTVQPEGHDYMMMIEAAEEDMKAGKGNYYVQRGSMYENDFLNKEEIKKTEEIADPEIRKQIIEEEYVEIGNKYFGYDRVANGVDKEIMLLSKGLPGRKYITSADFSGGETKWSDFTVILTLDYSEEPYRLVHFFRVKGNQMSIPMQYEKVREIKANFGGKVIIDGTSLGGKNAKSFLRDVKPIALDVTGNIKASMIQALKHALDGGQSERFRRKQVDGEDVNVPWGIVRYPLIPELLSELQNYKIPDRAIRNDIVITLAQAVYWIELRRPKQTRNKMVMWDII